MDGYQPNQSLSEALTALQSSVSIFLDQLSAERDILLNGNAEQLSEITDNKQQVLRELTLLENQIRPHLVKLNGGETNATALDDTSSLAEKKLWQDIVETLRECQQINLENGALVNTFLKHSKNVLNQLFSLANINNTVTYNEQGNQQFITESNRSVHV